MPQKALDFGFFVFPVVGGKKVPAISDWEHKASNDPEQIKTWCEKFPGCNWGCAPARSGHTVIDLDKKNGKDGEATLFDIELEYGNLPKTLSVITPTGGKHLYFIGVTASSKGRIGSGIDIRSKGGYVLIPPSKLPEGEYRWL